MLFSAKTITAACAAGLTAAGLLATAALAAQPAPPSPSSPVAARAVGSDVLPLPGELHTAPARAAVGHAAPVPVTVPLPPSKCRALFGHPCYTAALLRHIYGLDGPLARRGIDGHGTAVALITAFHDPVLRHDLDVFARQNGLPAPDLHVIAAGHPATADPGNFEQAISVQEGTLDAEAVLAMAPGARLDYIETQQDVGLTPASFSGAMDILGRVLPRLRPRVDAVSFSYGWFEENDKEATGSWAGARAMIRQQAKGVAAAVRHGITVVSADGDTGPTGPNLAGTGVYPDRTVAFIASDPLTTAVSASQIHAGDQGVRTQPDTVWTDAGDGFATGGGVSAIFARPGYQNPYAAVVGAHRGVGDVSMNGSGQSEFWMYTSVYNIFTSQASGWVRVAGTSEASPLFTGIVADAAQLAGHPLGLINPRLYAMAQAGTRDGVARITSGCNTADAVTGYCAGHGPYSLPAGIGTIGNAAQFVPALAGAATR